MHCGRDANHSHAPILRHRQCDLISAFVSCSVCIPLIQVLLIPCRSPVLALNSARTFGSSEFLKKRQVFPPKSQVLAHLVIGATPGRVIVHISGKPLHLKLLTLADSLSPSQDNPLFTLSLIPTLLPRVPNLPQWEYDFTNFMIDDMLFRTVALITFGYLQSLEVSSSQWEADLTTLRLHDLTVSSLTDGDLIVPNFLLPFNACSCSDYCDTAPVGLQFMSSWWDVQYHVATASQTGPFCTSNDFATTRHFRYFPFHDLPIATTS